MRSFTGLESNKYDMFDDAVKSRFYRGENNLFSLCHNPQNYLDIGQNEFYTDLIAYRFWILSEMQDESLLADMWTAELLETGERLGLFSRKKIEGHQFLEANFRLIPFNDSVYFADKYDRDNENMVYLSYDSLVFSELLSQQYLSGSTICDLFSGSGIIGLEAAKHCRESNMTDNLAIHFIDTNPRAISCSVLNAMLTNQRCGTSNGSYLEYGEVVRSSDLILFNPPFIFGPASRGYTDSDGGVLGVEHTVSMVRHLSEQMQGEANFLAITQTPLLDGCDVLSKALQGLSGLDIKYTVLDEFPPFSGYEDWYAKNGVSGFRQLFIQGKKSKSTNFHYLDKQGKYCFA
jgi:16S rRNA G966 N2-methylase RsmD